jgi:hypothetical protein
MFPKMPIIESEIPIQIPTVVIYIFHIWPLAFITVFECIIWPPNAALSGQQKAQPFADPTAAPCYVYSIEWPQWLHFLGIIDRLPSNILPIPICTSLLQFLHLSRWEKLSAIDTKASARPSSKTRTITPPLSESMNNEPIMNSTIGTNTIPIRAKLFLL